MQKKTYGFLTLALLLFLLTAGYCIFFHSPGTAQEKQAEQGVDVGKMALDFELKNMEGELVKLSDFRGQKVFLNFWATWCPPCRAEMPDMQQIHEDFEEVAIIAVNIQESPEQVQDFFNEKGLTFLALFDRQGSIAEQYRVTGIPTSIIVDEDGMITERIMGMVHYDRIKELLDL